jgi:hypothetical protein
MRAWPALLVAVGVTGGLAACGSDGLFQGDALNLEGALPVDPASDRRDAALSGCEGGGCEAGADAGPTLPVVDGATPPSNTCLTARAFGTVSGDTAAQVLIATGACSEWVSVRATEDNSSAIGAGMKLNLTLASTGHDFDLFVYYDPVRDVVACSSPFAASATPGLRDEIVALSWGEGTVANGSDDSRTVRVAVQSASGPCPPGASWTLTAAGNR